MFTRWARTRSPRSLALVLVVILWPISAYPTPKKGVWAAFLRNPNATTYRRVVALVEGCLDRPCQKEAAPDSAAVVKLVGLVNTGQPLAIDAAFLSYKLLDGGDLEGVARSLGEVADTSPRFFLQNARKHGLSAAQLGTIVRMLPVNTVDHDDRRRVAQEKRIRSLSSVDDTALVSARETAIAALRKPPGE